MPALTLFWFKRLSYGEIYVDKKAKVINIFNCFLPWIVFRNSYKRLNQTNVNAGIL